MRSALLAGLVGALAIVAVAAGAGGGKRLVRISGASPIPRSCDGASAQRGSEVEPTLAIDPRRGRRSLVAAWQQDRYVRGGGAAALGVAYSRDGGSSWKRALVPGITRCRGRTRRNSDPWLSTGPEGTVYLASLPGRVTRRDGLRTTVAVSVSRDGGASWSAARTTARAGSRFNDKETVTADPTRPGHAYLVWSQLDRLRFTRTLDAGRTWSKPRTIASGFEVNIAAISVLADGTLLHAFVRTGLRHDAFFVARSRNGGASWSRFRAVARVRDLAPRRGRYSVRTEPLASPPVVGAPGGAAYAAWLARGRRGFVRVLVARSRNRGRSWSRPRAAIAGRFHAFAPALAVRPNGTVGVAAYRLLRHGRADVVLARSANKGRSWHRRRLTSRFSLRRAPRVEPNGRRFLGDYIGLVGTRHGFATAAALVRRGRTDVYLAR